MGRSYLLEGHRTEQLAMLSQSGRLQKRRFGGARSLLKATQQAGGHWNPGQSRFCSCRSQHPMSRNEIQDGGRGGITGSILRYFGRQWHSLMAVMGSRDSVAGAVPGSPTPPSCLFSIPGTSQTGSRHRPLGTCLWLWRQLQALPVTLGKVKAAWTPS